MLSYRLRETGAREKNEPVVSHRLSFLISKYVFFPSYDACCFRKAK